MEPVLISSLITSSILVTGWFVNNYFNRKHDIFLKGLEHKHEMLKSYMPVAESLLIADQNGFEDNLRKSQILFLMYGTSEEIETINKIVELAQKDNINELQKSSSLFLQKIRNELREDLRIKKLSN
ncbi:hypothetical protein [Poseidonibacter lekithochrous]|uniref:hypothetical protein n=1 Tax=Poseidonibacter lekithochrous TaxID=1904463 RepID=UPI000D395EE3|nr:hypothetical protein [Poseidonibacter lekithochrous]